MRRQSVLRSTSSLTAQFCTHLPLPVTNPHLPPDRYGGATGMTGMSYGVAGQMSQIPPGGMDFSSPTAAGAGMAAAGGLGAATDLQTQQFSVPKGVSGG